MNQAEPDGQGKWNPTDCMMAVDSKFSNVLAEELQKWSKELPKKKKKQGEIKYQPVN